jgi:hypothetical protein
MSTLWNPRRPLTQPPSYGRITTVKSTPTSCPIAESAALDALKESRVTRARKAGKTAFDAGVKVRT